MVGSGRFLGCRVTHDEGEALSTSLGVTQSRGAATAGDAAPELPALTALRGMAAVIVLLYHGSFFAFHFAGGAPPWLWLRGSLAVDLFFFLSGFVLMHVYARRLDQDRSWRTTGRFLWARFSRIYPASVFTTLVFVVAYSVGSLPFPGDTSFTKQLVAALLLLQVPWLDDVVINSPSWSISAEWYAYLMFPFVAPMIWQLRKGTAIAVGLGLLLEIALYHTIFNYRQQAWGWGALLRALPEFTIGVFAYQFYSERLFRKIWEKDFALIAIAVMIATACLVGAPDSLSVVLLLALLIAAVCNSGHMATILHARPLRWLGEVSYSVYIFQILPFMVAVSLSGVLTAYGISGSRFEIIAVLFAFGSGVLVHRCVDVPARAALRRVPDWMMVLALNYWRTKMRLISQRLLG